MDRRLVCTQRQQARCFDVNGVFMLHITHVSLQNKSGRSLTYADVVWPAVRGEREPDHPLSNELLVTHTSYITNGLAEYTLTTNTKP